MPCHHFGHHHYPPPPGYVCPYCGAPHPPGYGPPPGPPGGPGYGWGYGRGWAPPGPAYPAPPRAMTDEEIRAAVSSGLRSDPRIPPQSPIEVEVHDGVVTLTGTVADKWVKYAANEVALGLPGVVDVQNNLRVQRPGREGPPGGAAAQT